MGAKMDCGKIADNRRLEEKRRRDYYYSLDRKRKNIVERFWNWLKGLFR